MGGQQGQQNQMQQGGLTNGLTPWTGAPIPQTGGVGIPVSGGTPGGGPQFFGGSGGPSYGNDMVTPNMPHRQGGGYGFPPSWFPQGPTTPVSPYTNGLTPASGQMPQGQSQGQAGGRK